MLMLASLYPQMASMACKQKVGVSEHILPYKSLAARRCGRNSLVPSFSNICSANKAGDHHKELKLKLTSQTSAAPTKLVTS